MQRHLHDLRAGQPNQHMDETGALHAARLKQKSKTKHKKKITGAVYLYQADNGGEWGEITFDFISGTAEMISLAGWDATVNHLFAKQAIRPFIYLLFPPAARQISSLRFGFSLTASLRTIGFCLQANPAFFRHGAQYPPVLLSRKSVCMATCSPFPAPAVTKGITN